jgi:hypothetical protein
MLPASQFGLVFRVTLARRRYALGTRSVGSRQNGQNLPISPLPSDVTSNSGLGGNKLGGQIPIVGGQLTACCEMAWYSTPALRCRANCIREATDNYILLALGSNKIGMDL